MTLICFQEIYLFKINALENMKELMHHIQKIMCRRAENLAAAIYSISGIRVTNFASFDFEGFEEIIDSVDGIEVCVKNPKRRF